MTSSLGVDCLALQSYVERGLIITEHFACINLPRVNMILSWRGVVLTAVKVKKTSRRSETILTSKSLL